MAAVYLRSEHKSSNGTEWKVDLYDEDYVSTVVDVEVQDLSITWDGNDDAVLEPIKASRAKWSFFNNSASVDTFLTAFAGGTERRFKMLIYKDSVLYWVGCCLMDATDWENLSKPTVITINAIDGLGRLEDIEYTDYAGVKTLYEHITDALAFNDLAQFWGAAEYYIRESCTFYDTQMTTTGTTYSPFLLTRCDGNLFLKEQNKTDNDNPIDDVAISCADVIRKILQLYCCRIIHTGGSYYIQQIRNFETASYNERAIDKAGLVRLVTTSRPHRQTENSTVNMLGGGQWRYYPPLQKVSVINYPQSTVAIASTGYQFLVDDHNNGDGTPLSNTIQLGTLRGGSGSGKALRVILKITDLTEGGANDKRVEVSVKISAGSYRLKSTATTPDTITWTTTAADTVDRVITYEDFASGGVYVLDITSPEFPSTVETSCTCVVSWEVAKRDGGSLTGTHNFRAHVLPIEIRVLTDGEEPSSTIYEVTNSLAVNSFEINYGKLTFHDTAELTSKNALEVYDATAWQQSGVVNAGYSANVELSKTLCLETMALQKTPLLTYNGPLVVDASLTKAQVDPSKTWYYESNTYFFNAGELRTNTDEMHGQWVKCLVAKTGLTINNEYELKKDLLGNIGGGVPKKKNFVFDYINRRTFAVLMGNATGTVTSLTTTQVINAHLRDNDTIYILHPVTFRTVETLVINGDVAALATTINVDSKAVGEDLLIGYLVVHAEYQVVAADRVRGEVINIKGDNSGLLTEDGDMMVTGGNLMYRHGSTNYTITGV